MRLILTFMVLCFFQVCLMAQHYFPVKIDKKWGLIDSNGELVLEPVYDAIGEFKDFGYAVMQRNGGVGLLDQHGKEIVKPDYEDLKVLDSTLIAVMDQGEWMVINQFGETILGKGYERVKVWNSQYIAYMRSQKWGLVDRFGREICEPKYDDIEVETADLFLTIKGGAIGLISATGREILDNVADEVNVLNDSLYFYKKGNMWGAINQWGREMIPNRYEGYKRISDHFIKLFSKGKLFLYSTHCSNLIGKGNYDNFYSFTRRHVIIKENRQLGLIDYCGNLVLPPRYYEIQAYGRDLFRVNYQGKWGVVKASDSPLIPFEYDYISPLKKQLCVVKKGAFFGIVNSRGQEVVEPTYDRIELEKDRARAYRGKSGNGESSDLTLLQFDEDGQLVKNDNFGNHFTVKIVGKNDPVRGGAASGEDSDYLLDNFEWFYSPAVDRWGLRRLADGEIQIEPKFHYVQVEKDLGSPWWELKNLANTNSKEPPTVLK